MAYRLEADEDPQTATRRLVAEQVEEALGALRDATGPERDDAVHTARKAFKRVRAVLRLVRSGLDSEAYATENRRFRDLGRALADARDARVLLDTLTALSARHAEGLSDDAFAGLRVALANELGALRGRSFESADVTAPVVDELERVEAALPSWAVAPDLEVFEVGLERAYRRGRKRFLTARDDPSPEHLHQWRKRAKDSWYHLTLFQPAWPTVLGALESEADRLSDLLGEEHDLHVLERAALERPGGFRSPAEQQLLGDLLERRRQDLHRELFEVGPRLYADRPGRFARWIMRLHALSPPRHPATTEAAIRVLS